MKLAFTGTRFGMTPAQMGSFARFVADRQPTEFHHGDCVGADDEAAGIVSRVCPSCKIIGHPPEDEAHRAFNKVTQEWMPAASHFKRNRQIVDACDHTVVLPRTHQHQSMGGTWYTHDHSLKIGKSTTIIWPNGAETQMQQFRR